MSAERSLCPAEMHRHVHGPLHGRLEHGFASLQLPAAAGKSQHVKCPGAGRDHVGKGRAASPGGWGRDPAAFAAPAMAEQ